MASGGGRGLALFCRIEPAARVASLEKILFSNFKISRKKYSLEKQLEINHTAGSVLPNDREWRGASANFFAKLRIKSEKALTREKITERSRVQFPVGTQSMEMIILSTSQAGLRRAAVTTKRSTSLPSFLPGAEPLRGL